VFHSRVNDMNRSRRRNRNNNRSQVTVNRRNFVTTAQLHRDNRGYVPRGRFDPPRIVVQPWNSVTLAAFSSITQAGIAQYSVSSIGTLLKSQIGAPDTSALVIRVSRVDVWTTPTDVLTNTALNLALRPSSLYAPDAEDGSYQWIEDFGTATRPAHCHFVWPQSQQARTYVTSENTDVVIFAVDVPIAQSIVIHLRVLWKFLAGDPVPSTRLQITPKYLAQDFERLHLGDVT